MKTANLEMNNERIRDLEAKIDDLKKRWPAHSVPPMMMQELDDLEDELAKAMRQAHQGESNA